MMKNYR